MSATLSHELCMEQSSLFHNKDGGSWFQYILSLIIVIIIFIIIISIIVFLSRKKTKVQKYSNKSDGKSK